MADKIYLLRGNDTPMAVCLRKSEGEGDPVPYDLSTAERMRLAIVGHGMHVFASGVTVSGEDNNIVSGVIPGRSLLPGDYDLELTFVLDGRDKRFAVEDMFEAVNFLAEDADGTAEGEGDGISITVTVQPEVIEIAGPTGPQGHDGKSAYEVWLDEGHTGTEDDFFKWLASEGLPWNDVDISSLTVRNGYITSSGVWNSGSTYCHTLLPVSAGKAVRVTAAESNLFRYAWLTSGQAPRGGIAADLVPGTERTDVAAGSSVTLDVPVGAKYLYIYLGTPEDKANTPESMAVSDTIASLRKDTDTNAGDIAVLGEEARHSGVYGHFDGAGTSISDGGNIYVVAGMSYRLTMLHPDITVTDPTGNVWRLVVSARDDSGAVVSNLVQVSDVSRLSDHYDLTIPAGATRLHIYGRCAAGQTCDYVLERLDTQTYNDGDILTLNPDSEFQPKWQSASKPYYTSQNTNRPNCVKFLHLSDVHGNWANARRFLKFYNHWVDKGYGITAINTGDTATDYLTDGVTGYTSINGVDKILGVVGNHDTRGTSGWQQYKGLEVYNALFAPLISGWGVVQPEGAAENGYCYYHKDYASNKLRLVVVDIMGYDDTEDAWLASVLASAKTAGYHVLIATHFAGGRSSAEASQPPYKKIDCQWSTMAGLASDSTQLNGYNSESYKMADTVHAFMEDGGIFCGYMCGHSHLEFVARLDKYPDQMIYTIGSSKSGKVHDYTHTAGTRMQDEFEIVAVDTDSKFVKLYKVGANYDRRGRLKDSVCVSYDTHEVVGFPVTAEGLAKEMDDKQDTLISGENIKTINGQSVLGEGDIVIQTGSADAVKYTEQELTEAQQAQARTNIAAASESEVSQLRSEVDGYNVPSSVPLTNTNKYYKTDSVSIGQAYSPSTTNATGFSSIKVATTPGQTYKIWGVGTTNLVNLYVLTGENNKALAQYKGNTREEPVTVTITEAGYLYVNFTGYDSVQDKVIVYDHVPGLMERVNDLEHKNLYGKTIVCFGDSLTEKTGVGGKSYPEWLAEISGATVVNVGIGGTQLRERGYTVSLNPTTTNEAWAGLDIVNMVRAACRTPFDSSHTYLDVADACAEYLKNNAADDNTPQVARIASTDWSKVDAVILFGGTNDWYGAGNNDHWGQSGSTNVNYTLGAINVIIRTLSEAYPNIRLYWCTPVVRWIDFSDPVESKFSDNLTVYNKTLREFAKMVVDEVKLSHIPVCDLYNDLGWNIWNFSAFFTTTDGTHPWSGYYPIARRIYSFVEAHRSF